MWFVLCSPLLSSQMKIKIVERTFVSVLIIHGLLHLRLQRQWASELLGLMLAQLLLGIVLHYQLLTLRRGMLMAHWCRRCRLHGRCQLICLMWCGHILRGLCSRFFRCVDWHLWRPFNYILFFIVGRWLIRLFAIGRRFVVGCASLTIKIACRIIVLRLWHIHAIAVFRLGRVIRCVICGRCWWCWCCSWPRLSSASATAATTTTSGHRRRWWVTFALQEFQIAGHETGTGSGGCIEFLLGTWFRCRHLGRCTDCGLSGRIMLWIVWLGVELVLLLRLHVLHWLVRLLLLRLQCGVGSASIIFCKKSKFFFYIGYNNFGTRFVFVYLGRVRRIIGRNAGRSYTVAVRHRLHVRHRQRTHEIIRGGVRVIDEAGMWWRCIQRRKIWRHWRYMMVRDHADNGRRWWLLNECRRRRRCTRRIIVTCRRWWWWCVVQFANHFRIGQQHFASHFRIDQHFAGYLLVLTVRWWWISSNVYRILHGCRWWRRWNFSFAPCLWFRYFRSIDRHTRLLKTMLDWFHLLCVCRWTIYHWMWPKWVGDIVWRWGIEISTNHRRMETIDGCCLITIMIAAPIDGWLMLAHWHISIVG